MKRILVPTDFSKTATNAMDFAVELAKQDQCVNDNCVITVVTVIEQPGVNSWTLGGPSTLPNNMLDNLYFVQLIEKTKDDMKQFIDCYDNVDIDTKIMMGTAYQSIAKTITDLNADLVIMGSKGEDDAEDFLLGSNAEKVVRFASCPVIIIKKALQIADLNDIVIASEFYDNMDRLMKNVKELQDLFGAKLHLVRVNTPSDFERTRPAQKRLEEFAKKHELKNFECCMYADLTPEDGILSYAEDVNAKLIALTTSGRSSLVQFITGSVASDVVNHADRAVMTIKIDR